MPSGTASTRTPGVPVLRPPFAYYGGKTRLAPMIAAALPDHTQYVEPYAGSLAVLFAKAPARLETVNDLDGDIVHFWRVLRERPDELARACALTPHARTERTGALQRPSDLDDVERARRIWVCLTAGRTGTLRNTGWRYDTSDAASTSMPRRLAGYVARIDAVAARLRSVSLEHRNALEVIEAYGGGRRTVIYADPPYVGEVRTRNYRTEMTSATDHHALAERLNACQATVVLSGYASELYDRKLYRDWYRTELRSHTSQSGTWEHRTEVLWSNRPLRIDDSDPACNGTPSTGAECNETRCQAADCARVLTQPATGRPRRFCSPACRVRAHRHTTTTRKETHA
ncbi:DNA adenine methylase [Rhodococcus sp. KRD197]|uniref:DNA adenine methylase n=1 Tax=Rhodococcus sp. KRD197 TaxID=2729731 RepID=UPI0027DA75BD|nr:DNA adenine methylase [Rhodococcus sp. KRD197]